MIPWGNTFIWGAGKWGRLAYAYYRESCNIVGYIDKNEKLSGMEVDGIPIYSPDILKTQKASIIIAVKRGVDGIKRLLCEEYGIKETAVFIKDCLLQPVYATQDISKKSNIFK